MISLVRSPFYRKCALPILVFIIGFVLTMLATSHVAKDNKKEIYKQTVEYAERHANRIQSQIQQDVFFLGALANLVDEHDISRIPRFNMLSKHIMSGSAAIVSIQWSPKVKTDEFTAHKMKIQNNYLSFTDFNFRKEKVQRFSTLLERKIPLYVVSQVYPITKENISILGFYSISTRVKNIVQKMEATQQPYLSDRVFLLQDTYNKEVSNTERQEKQNALLMYYPVFNQGKSEMLGFFMSAIRIDAFFEKHLKLDAIKSRGYSIKVFDHGPSGGDDPILYQSKTWLDQQEETVVSQHIDIYGRPWEIKYKKNALRTFSITSNAIITLICGIFISILIACIVRFSLHSKDALRYKLALRTKELQYLVEHDTLTDVYNRYALCNHFDALIEQKIRFSLITIDVDKFKLINDTYGHFVGDQALNYVVSKVCSVIGSKDMLARMGGDEFSILTTVTDKTELTQVCQNICKAISDKTMVLDGKEISITVSIGAKFCRSSNIDDLYHEVDLEMYKSKSAGRNGFSVAE